MTGSFRLEPVRTAAQASSRLYLGDPAFDAVFVLGGDEAVARARLDAVARAALVALEPELVALEVDGAGWSVDFDPHAAVDEDALARLARHWSPPMEFDGGLLEVALEDPEVRVRAGAAEVLLRRAPQLGEAAAGRLLTPLILGVRVRPRHRADALWRLSRWAPAGARVLLPHLLEVEDEAVRADALSWAASLGASEARPRVLEALSDPSPRVTEAAWAALAELGGLEDLPLLRTAWREGARAAKLAALRGFARLGGAPERAALRLAERRVSKDAELSAALESTVEALDTRLPPAGALSPPNDEDGAVSVACANRHCP